MSLTITIRPNGTKTGGETFKVPSEGDNGNQEIDTKGEAETALALLLPQPEGTPPEKINSVFVGEKEYTRKQLEDIRDGKNGASASVETKAGVDTKTADAVDEKKAEGAEVRGEGASHGFFLQGMGFMGLGDPSETNEEGEPGSPGHDGGEFSIGYIAGIPIGLTGLFFDPMIGFRLNHGEMAFKTPGGEDGTSSFTSYGAVLGGDLRYVLPVLDDRLFGAIGLRGTVGGFTTPEGEKISLPGGCTADDKGRSECEGEPAAGPREHYDGLSGAYVPRAGAARPGSGVALDLDIPITVGVNVAQGEWGSLGIAGQFIPGITGVLPSDGDGFSFWRIGGGAAVIGRFGGSAARVPAEGASPTDDDDADGVTNENDKCENTPKTEKADEDGCADSQKVSGLTVDGVVSSNAADAAGQNFIVKLDPAQSGEVKNAKIVGADKKAYDVVVDPTKLEETNELSVTPKEKLPAGKYVFEFDIEKDGVKKHGKIAFEVKDVKALNVAITPDAGNAPAEKTASDLSFGVTTDKAVTITPRFVLQGATAGLSKNFYPTPTTYDVDASEAGKATSFAFKTPDNLPAGKYTVIFDVKAKDGTVKRVTTTMDVKKMDAKPVFEIAGSFKVGDALVGKMKPSEKVAAPGLPVTYVVSGPGGSGPQRTATLTDKSEDLNLSCPPALLTQGGKIYRTSKKGTYKVTVTYAGGKTVEQTFEVK